MKTIALLLLVLAGCARTAPPAPCPDLSALTSATTLADLEAHHLAVVRLYGMCRAAQSPSKLKK